MLTLEVLGTLSLFTRLADDLDGTTREDTDDTFRLIIRGSGSDFDKGFNFLLLLINIRDEELLPDAAADVGGTCGRITDIE